MPYAFSRRTALFGAAGTAAFVAAPPGANAVRLGGPIFLKTADPRELAREHRRLGYSAAYCPDAKLDDTARIRDIENAFKAEGVIIAEVGAWVNMLDPDEEKRKANLKYVTERLALAEAAGARCCVDIAGSYNPKIWYGPHPRNFSREFFEATVENCRLIIDEVRPRRAKFAIEMMGWAAPDSADSYLELVRAVDRKAFGVHIDVCNGINSPARFYNNRAFIADCFEKLGPWIVSCHAKDLAWKVEMNVHFLEVVPGRGEMDYSEYLRQLSRLPSQPPLMLEHLSKPEEYDEGRQYIMQTAHANGIALA